MIFFTMFVTSRKNDIIIKMICFVFYTKQIFVFRMNYIDNINFISNELKPCIDNLVCNYIDEEIEYAESMEELDEIEYMNCPEELMEEILEEVHDLILECLDDYDIITISEDDFEYKIGAIVDDEFEKIKNKKLEIRREDFEKLDYFEEEDDYLY